MRKILFLGLLVLSCSRVLPRVSPKGEDEKVNLPPGTSDITRLPTNPDGGLIPGRNPDLSEEESAARQQANAAKPLTFGVSAAGVTMDMPRSEIMKVLANPEFIADDGAIFYPEFLSIFWLEGEDPKPEAIVVRDGYKGKIELPEPFAALTLGQTYVDLLADEAAVNATLHGLARAISARGADYDCEVAGECYFQVDDESGDLNFYFPKGLVIFDKTGKLAALIYQTIEGLPKRTREPIVYGTSIGGVSFASTRAEVEERIGPSFETEEKFSAYDDGSIVVQWGEDDRPLLIRANFGLKGKLKFSEEFEAGLGQPFADPSQPEDDGKGLMVFLDRLLHQRQAGFDCSKGKKPLCSYRNEDGRITIDLEKGSFVFTADAQRFWIGLDMKK